MKMNVLGMDNCFEVARLLGVKHTIYAGSFAANGQQANYGERHVTEDDPVYGEYQYARHKIVNEWQAQDSPKNLACAHRYPPRQRHRAGQGTRLG